MNKTHVSIAQVLRTICFPISSIVFLAAFCFGQPAISLSPSSGPPTTELQIAGSGFAAYAEVDIYFGTKDEALAVADGSGSFSKIGIETPAAAKPGSHWVSAVQRSGGTGAQSPFLVSTNWSQPGFSPTHQGFNPFENLLNSGTIGQVSTKWSYPGSTSAPSVANGLAYFSTEQGAVVAVSSNNGKPAWTYATGATIVTTPAVSGGVVYVGAGNNVDALNAATGALLWTYPTGDTVISSPVAAANMVYFGSDDNNVYAVNAATGALVWKYTTGLVVQSSPSVANGIAYFASNGTVYAVNALTGMPIWKYLIMTSYASSTPSVVNGVLYVGSADNSLYALNASNGTLLWQFTDLGAPLESSTPAVANGVVYEGSDDFNFYALNASTGEVLWTFATKGPINSSPVVANGIVYTGSGDENFYALDASSGSLLWQYTTDSYIPSAVVTNGNVYLATGSSLLALGLFKPATTDLFNSTDNPANAPGLKSLHPDFSISPSKSSAAN